MLYNDSNLLINLFIWNIIILQRVKTNGDLHKGDALIAREKPSANEPDFSYDPAFLNETEQQDIIENLSKLPWQKVFYII